MPKLFDQARVDEAATFIAAELKELLDRKKYDGHMSQRLAACPAYGRGLTNSERILATLKALDLVGPELVSDLTSMTREKTAAEEWGDEEDRARTRYSQFLRPTPRGQRSNSCEAHVRTRRRAGYAPQQEKGNRRKSMNKQVAASALTPEQRALIAGVAAPDVPGKPLPAIKIAQSNSPELLDSPDNELHLPGAVAGGFIIPHREGRLFQPSPPGIRFQIFGWATVWHVYEPKGRRLEPADRLVP